MPNQLSEKQIAHDITLKLLVPSDSIEDTIAEYFELKALVTQKLHEYHQDHIPTVD